MYQIKKAYRDDFERIYPLFEYFNNEVINKNTWQNLFEPMCKELNNDFFGFYIEDEHIKEILGFVGFTLSQRLINGEILNIASFSSWVVKPEYREKGISRKLLEAAFNLPNFHFQIITPIKRIIPLLIQDFNFKACVLKHYTIVPLPKFTQYFSKAKLNFGSAILSKLSPSEKKIYSDHLNYNCYHVLIETVEGYSYIVIKPTSFTKKIFESSKIWVFFTKVWYKLFKINVYKAKINLGFIHFVSNSGVFEKNINILSGALCNKLKIEGISVHEKHIKRPAFNIIKNKMTSYGVYKSDTLKETDFDTLYSELILFDLSF